jgi:hypothetical protein
MTVFCSRANSRASILARAAWAALLLTGCQQILGIDKLERGITEMDGGVDPLDAGNEDAEVTYEKPSEADCKEYCDLVNDTCKPDGTKAAFANPSYCEGLCPHMLKVTDGPTAKTNTFDCRLAQARTAATVAPDNAGECRSVGAGGDGACGSNCESYCQLYDAVCGSIAGLSRGPTCLRECQNLPEDRQSNAAAAFSSESDTIQCRLAHLGAAAAGKAAENETLTETHCKHAQIHAAIPCVQPKPKCEDFCALVDRTCTGAMQQYETTQDCVAICNKGLTSNVTPLPADMPLDIAFDTVACRRYHTYNAMKAPDGVHCEHAGPTGDGHCGGKVCPSFCQMSKAACGMQYMTKFGSNEAAATAACIAECDAALTAEGVKDQYDHHYSVAKGKAANADKMQCRVYRLSKAFLSPGSHCEAALGNMDCR